LAVITTLVVVLVAVELLAAGSAVVLLKSTRISQNEFEQRVSRMVTVRTGEKVRRIMCGRTSEDDWECFLTFVDGRKVVALATLRGAEIAKFAVRY
jgi:hypothetical protein